MYRQDILIDLFISIHHTSVCSKGPSTPYLHKCGSCSMMLYSLILLCMDTVGILFRREGGHGPRVDLLMLWDA